MNRRAFLSAPLALMVPVPDAVPMPFTNVPTAIEQWARDQAFIRRRAALRDEDVRMHKLREEYIAHVDYWPLFG